MHWSNPSETQWVWSSGRSAKTEREASLSFGTKIVSSQALVVLMAAAVSSVMLATLRLNDGALREVRDSYEQTLAITTMSASANDYAEQIAELFVLGDDTSEIVIARDGLLSAVDLLAAQIAEEIAVLRTLGDDEEIAEEQVELDRLVELRRAVAGIETARVPIEAALAAGRVDEARTIYRVDVENRFDETLGRLMDDAVRRERGEVIDSLEAIDVLGGWLRLVSFALVALTLLAATMLTAFLYRSVLRPVAALTEGTEAVARGDLDYRVHIPQTDELGRLADRFNDMMAEIGGQREALIASKVGLEDQVAARTAELREVALKQKDLAKSRARVLADLSHELRTPLTVVRGKAEVTLRDPDAGPTEMRLALERIVAKAEQMSRLVDDMLFVARSEAGAVPIERAPVDMRDVLADVLLDSRELARRKDISILPKQSDAPVRVQGDAGRLRQAVLIPIDNAVRIAPPGSVVRVMLEATEGHAVVTVSDDGPGFAAEEVERAFSRFWQGRPGTKGKGRGSGLGLSIARWILERHDGAIRLENHEGGGATVRLEVPLDPGHCGEDGTGT